MHYSQNCIAECTSCFFLVWWCHTRRRFKSAVQTLIKRTFLKVKQTSRQPAPDLAPDVDGMLQPLVLPPLPLPPLILLLLLPPGLECAVISGSKRIWRRINIRLFRMKRISGFYMRNEYKRKQIFLAKRILYLFRFKANTWKQNEMNIFNKNRLFIEV